MEQDMKLRLREAVAEDADFLYRLRNEEEVRKNSFHTEKIPYEKHVCWFREKLCDEAVQMLILMAEETPIGQVRIDMEENQAKISYAICKDARGRGWSKWMLGDVERRVEKKYGQHYDRLALVGEVKRENIASRKVFRFLGYREEQTEFGFRYIKDIM